jgi:hypothetical protein
MAGAVTPLPKRGRAFLDARDGARSLRTSWHPNDGVFVISMWHGASCIGTFHLDQTELSTFIGGFVDQLAQVATASEWVAGAGVRVGRVAAEEALP